MPQDTPSQIPGQDVLLDTLRSSPLRDEQRQGIWDAYKTPGDQSAFIGALNKLDINDDVKQSIYDMRWKGFKNPAQPQGYDAQVKSMPNGARALEELYPGISKSGMTATGMRAADPTPSFKDVMLDPRAAVKWLDSITQRPESGVFGLSSGNPFGLLPGESKGVIDPTRAMTPMEQQASPILTGVGKFVASSTTPENLATMAAMAPISAVNAGAAARAIGGGFATAMGVGGAQKAAHGIEEYQAGRPEQAKQDLTEAALSFVTAGWSAHRAVSGGVGPTPISRAGLLDTLPEAPRAPTGAPSEVPGSRVMNAPEAPVVAPAGPKVADPTPVLRPEVAEMAKPVTQTPEMRDQLIDHYKQIARHPQATAEDRVQASQRLSELGALQTIVPTVERPAPAARSVEDIVKTVSPENRPKNLPVSDLQQLAELSPAAAKEAGLKRDDHLAAKAAWKRTIAPPEDAPVTTPGTELHQSLTRVLRAKDNADIGTRSEEYQNALSKATSQPPNVKEKIAASFDYRAQQAGQLSESLTRIRDGADYAKSVTEELRRNASGNIASERVGVDTSGHTFVEPLTEEQATEQGKTFTPNFQSGISSAERMALNTWKGNVLGGSYGKGRIPRIKVAFDPESRTPMVPGGVKSLAPEEQAARKDLATNIQKEIQGLHGEVWAQGGVPSAEQHSKMVELFSLLESTTGHSLRASSKGKPTGADAQTLDPNRAWMNWAMRRPATSHFAKPDADAMTARIKELGHEKDIAELTSGLLRKSLPKDHVANPDAPKVAAAPVKQNGSGESAASVEAINRAKTEAPRERVDTRSGIATPIAKTVDAVDVRPQPHEVIMQGGKVVESGAKALPTPHVIKRYDPSGKLIESKTEMLTQPAPVEATPLKRAATSEELSQMRTHLANLELKGQAGTTTAVRLRKAIQQYESVLGESKVDQGFITNIASSMLYQGAKTERANAPKVYTQGIDTSNEGKGDDLVALLATATGEGVPRALHSAILKLHDLTPEEDRDYLAHAAMASGMERGIDEVARRYAGALQVLRAGLKAGEGLQALQRASKFAQTGKMPTKSAPGEAGFAVIPKFIPDILNELGKYTSNAAVGAVDVFKWTHRWLQEGTYHDVSRESRDAMFKFRGELNRIEDLGRVAFNDGIVAIRSLPTAQQDALMANAQLGQPLPTQDLQGMRDVLQQLQDQHWVRMRELRPSLPYWRDHIGTIWEKPPSNAAQLFEKHANVVNHAVLQGDKGMLRARLYETVLDGIAHGGVPATHNLFEMGLLDLGRQAQYIHAQDLLKSIKEQGRLARGPEEASLLQKQGLMPNPVRVPDHIVSTWFPVETSAGGTVIAKGAPHYMEKGELAMLQKWLAPDFVRKNVVGRTLIGLKNIYTPVELLGPFHLASIAAKSSALGLSQGINRAFNAGVLQNDLGNAVDGLKEALTGLAMPFTAYKNGRILREAGGQTLVGWQKYSYDKQNFLATPDGKRLSKVIPNIEDTIDGLLEAGARLDVNPQYATKWRQSMVQSWLDKNYIKSAASVPFAALEKMTGWLFQKYIPAVKLFAASKEISVELARQAPMIQSGETTKQAVMQAAVRRVDNILGELNWDTLNASKGMRSLAMLAYRAPGWRMGTVDLVKNAAQGEFNEFYQGAARQRIPTIDPNLLYIMSMVGMGAAISTVIMALMAHKAPSSITDLTNPQTGQVDSRGKPIRLDLPLYTSRDIPEILTNPFGYATGGQSGFISKSVEAFKNRTYQGSLVTEKGGVWGAAERVLHGAVPVPFGYTGYQRLKSQGFPASQGIALNIAGLNPSRRDLDMTPSERILSDAERRFSITRDAKETAKLQAKQSIQGAFLNNRFDDLRELEMNAMKAGTLSFREVEDAVKLAQKPYIERMASGSAVRPKDLLRAYAVANESERRALMPFVWKALKKQPDLAPEFQKLVQAHQ